MRRRKEPRAAIHAVPTSDSAHKSTSNSVTPVQYALSIGDVAAMMVLASGTLLGYTVTLYPSIAGGDSGELVAESCHLGVSHPPGYPLFNMIVHLFTQYLPFGDTPAWRANFFSAVCDTVAVGFIYQSLLQWMAPTGWTGRRVAAFTAAALFGFSPLIWTYAVGAEVFALNNAFAAVLVFLLLQYARRRDIKSALAGAFTCGLATCNQHTIVLFELPIIAWVLWSRRRSLWRKEFAQFTGAFVLGLTPYIYMPITAIWNPQPGSWGDVTTLSGLIHHIRRADYGTFRLYASNEANEDLWTRLYLYGVDLSDREIPFQLAVPVVGLGMLQTLRASTGMNRQLGWFLIAMYAFYMIVFHSLANLPISEGLIYGVQMRFWQQPNVVVFIWFGVGLGYVVNLVTEGVGGTSRVIKSVVSLMLQVACLALGDGFSMARLLDTNIGQAAKASQKRLRFFLGGKLSFNDQDFNEKYTLVPYGLLDEFQSLTIPSPSLKNWYSSQQQVKTMIRERLTTLPPEEIYNDETWEWTIARDHGMKELNWATYLLERTIAEDPENLILLTEAAKPMELSYQLEPLEFWNAASNLKNLGLAYAQIVKSSQEFTTSTDPFFNGVVGAGVEISTRFKDRASARMLEVWDAWLQVPEAKQDQGYEPIKSVVRKFIPEEKKPGKSRKQSQRRKKKKTSKKTGKK
ncbi:hypothetical protein JG687_00011626 [Phytophthora cactorum]|uniref:DUF2723 domain-containing protein n=1 Tax=Phytophthora cactorum TaxID=29920 RepID=A0A8T1U8Q1_9STRA|nr:hypothetical protein JG687_00011626 [Phytophthora cactorum]